MKKLLYFAAAATLLSACVKEADQLPASGYVETITFEAKTSAETRTTLVDGTKIYWCSGDKISVMGATFTNELAPGETAAVTSFTGDVETADTYYAVYPAEAVTGWNGNVATVKTPMRQEVTAEGSFVNGANISAANTTAQDKSFSFKNVMGYVKVGIPEDIKTVIITANGGEALSGPVTIDCASPVAVQAENFSNCVTLFNYSEIPAGVHYIALLPGIYSEGLTFDFVDTDDEVATMSVNGPVELEAGHINSIGNLSDLPLKNPAAGIENVIWKGKFVSGFWDSGLDLTQYDWSAVKAGDVLKIYGGATMEGATISLRKSDWASNLTGSEPYISTGLDEVSVTITEEMAADLQNGGLIVQGQHYFCTAIALVPGAGDPEGSEIPEDYEAVTLWEGSMQMAWGTAMQELAYGLYNWGNCKPGQYLKIYVTPTDPTASWIVQVNYADASYSWVPVPSLSNYNNVEEIVIELTEELISLFATPNNGFLIQGENATATKVELYREPAGATGYALTMTNTTVADSWSTQVWYTLEEPLKAGTEYIFSCVIKSTVVREWCSVLLQSADGLDQNFDHGMNLFTDWTPTVITFTPDKDNYTKITFNIGDFEGVVSIDNVSMKEKDTDVELIKNGDFESGLTTGWSSWSNAQGIGEGYAG